MKPNEIKVAVVFLALVGSVWIYLAQHKSVLGKPGVIVEQGVLTNEHGIKVADHRVALPMQVPGYKVTGAYIADMEVNWLPKDTTFGRALYFGERGFWAQMSTVLMGTDRTSIHRPQFCLVGQGWHLDKTEVISIPMTRPKPYELKAQLVTASQTYARENGASQPVVGLYVYWFVADNELTPNLNQQMRWLARDLLREGVLRPWAYVSCFSYCSPGQEGALLEEMKRLIATATPEFQIPPGNAPQQTASLAGVRPLN
jgi:hypothetical protein